MAYNYESGYVDTKYYNDDWLLNRMKEVNEEMKEWQDVKGTAKKIVMDTVNQMISDGAIDDIVKKETSEVYDTLSKSLENTNKALSTTDGTLTKLSTDYNTRMRGTNYLNHC